MMGNEYIAHKLEGVLQAGRAGEVSEQAAMGELMTHLWLRVTQGSGPFEEVCGARATSEHM